MFCSSQNARARTIWRPDFDAANKLYEEGKYADAANAYDKLLTNGTVSEAIYFNRGNAWFKAGQVGRAIASYRQARLLAPRDSALRANLQLGEDAARGRLECIALIAGGIGWDG